MSKDNKSQEFWLEIGNDCDDVVWWRRPVNEKTIHVIEYKAYEDLKTKHERALKALMFAEVWLEKASVSYQDGPGMFIARQFDDRIYDARKALEVLHKIKTEGTK